MHEPDADEQMRAHFDQRAAEYDGWWLGTGSYAERERPGWSAEVEQLIGVVQSLPPARVLDVACGTGFLTQHLRGELVALDQSARMVEIAAARMPHARVIQGDVATAAVRRRRVRPGLHQPLLHHLSSDGRAAFIAEARRVGRELVVVEDLRRPDAPAEERREFVLDDGSHHHMHRHSFTAAELIAELGGGQVLHEGRWFVVVAAS